MARLTKRKLIENIVNRLARQYGTAAILFHQSVATGMGLGPTDHKCLDLLREKKRMSGSELASITGLTTGAITGVVARLEQGGFLRREADPEDQRRQILSPVMSRLHEISDMIGPLRADMATLLAAFDAHQLSAITDFLSKGAELTYLHMDALRAKAVAEPVRDVTNRATKRRLPVRRRVSAS